MQHRILLVNFSNMLMTNYTIQTQNMKHYSCLLFVFYTFGNLYFDYAKDASIVLKNHFSSIIFVNYVLLCIIYTIYIFYLKTTNNNHLRDNKNENLYFRLIKNFYIHFVPLIQNYAEVRIMDKHICFVLTNVMVYFIVSKIYGINLLKEYNLGGKLKSKKV